ncbi:MAG: cell division protein FtsH, partial [Gemmobacter sp.]
ETARRILIDKAEDFERMAKGLLEYETLTGDEIRKVLAGEPLDSGEDDETPSGGDAPSVTAIPKTRPRPPKSDDGGMEPEPSA